MDNRSFQAMPTEFVPRTIGRRHAACGSSAGGVRRLLINAGLFFRAVLAIASLAACGTVNGGGVGYISGCAAFDPGVARAGV